MCDLCARLLCRLTPRDESSPPAGAPTVKDCTRCSRPITVVLDGGVGLVRLLRLKPGGPGGTGTGTHPRTAARRSTRSNACSATAPGWCSFSPCGLQTPHCAPSSALHNGTQNPELRSPCSKHTLTAAAQWRLVGDREDQETAVSCLTSGGRMAGRATNICTHITVASPGCSLSFRLLDLAERRCFDWPVTPATATHYAANNRPTNQPARLSLKADRPASPLQPAN